MSCTSRAAAGAATRLGDLVLAGAEVLTPAAARARIETVPPGASFCWYRGFLPTDRPDRRSPGGADPVVRRDWSARRRRAVGRLACFMWGQAVPASPRQAARGLLWQRRMASMHYEYWFTRSGEV